MTQDAGLGTSAPSTKGTKSAVGSRQSAAEQDFARRTIARRGCAGCHDIPGVENAPAIGPALAGWGRKPESLLAFEQINDLLQEPLAASRKRNKSERTPGQESSDDFLADALLAHRREGFVWQKLRAPRSFDYKIADSRPIDEQLKMGRFELTDAQREAIVVFILAQVEQSPSTKYVYHPDPRRKAVIEGRKVIDKYACTECHTLELERWTLGSGKGVRYILPERPSGCCAQNVPDPFSGTSVSGVSPDSKRRMFGCEGQSWLPAP